MPIYSMSVSVDGFIADREGRTGERGSLMSQEQMHEAPLSVGADSTVLRIAGAHHIGPAFHKPAVVDAVTAFFEAVLT